MRINNSVRVKISIHALREEGDPAWERQKQPRYLFLSTPSARRATIRRTGHDRRQKISIHALREEGDLIFPQRANVRAGISIHALREEGDADRPPMGGHRFYFYPRPPRGGRHDKKSRERRKNHISIHALREEGDLHSVFYSTTS